MNQPIYWSILLGVVVIGTVLRIVARRPLVPAMAARLRVWEVVVASVAGLVLIFHCVSMFFAAWVNAVPWLEPAAEAIRNLGTISELMYWVPAAALLVAWRGVWWPALLVLAGSLIGVGVTMFFPYPLTVHLVWLAFAILAALLISVFLVGRPVSEPTRTNQREAGRRPDRQPSRP